MTKRKYRTDEEWLYLIQECRSSGLTDKQWCETHQICPSNFYYQIQKLRKRACEIPESQSKTTLTAQKQGIQCLSPAKKYKVYKNSINKSLHFAQRRLSSSTRGQRVTAQLNLSRE